MDNYSPGRSVPARRGWRCHLQGVTLTWTASGQLQSREIGSCSARMAMSSTTGDIDLDGQWTTTVQGDRFLLGEDGDGVDKIMVFTSDSARPALANANTCHMDDTFVLAPRLFYQIVTLHAFVLGVTLPLVLSPVLVKEKSASLGFTISHQRIMHDFEKGLINAYLHVFPGVILKGCYFHYDQCLWRRLPNMGLSVSYRENADNRNWFRVSLAMPLSQCQSRCHT